MCVFWTKCLCQLIVSATSCKHADMLMPSRLMSEHSKSQVPGLLWIRLAIDQTIGLIVLVWLWVMAPLSPKRYFPLQRPAHARFLYVYHVWQPWVVRLGMVDCCSLVSTCNRGHLELTLWRHFVSYQNKTLASGVLWSRLGMVEWWRLIWKILFFEIEITQSDGLLATACVTSLLSLTM